VDGGKSFGNSSGIKRSTKIEIATRLVKEEIPECTPDQKTRHIAGKQSGQFPEGRKTVQFNTDLFE
jgi:hypothetical protein